MMGAADSGRFARTGAMTMTSTSDPTREPRAYPVELAEDVISERGKHLHMRPIRPDDAALLVEFHARLSSDSVYRRYFSLHPVLTKAEVRHLTEVDYADRFAFIVLDGDVLVGVARYDRIPGTTEAEVAFVVEDIYQGEGIGLLLLEHLVDAALPLGITTFTAETQASNRNMMNVFYYSGYTVETSLEQDIISVRFPIAPTDASRAVRAKRAALIARLGPESSDQH
jgi:GNAT superfamily N-acetyltransferase